MVSPSDSNTSTAPATTSADPAARGSSWIWLALLVALVVLGSFALRGLRSSSLPGVHSPVGTPGVVPPRDRDKLP